MGKVRKPRCFSFEKNHFPVDRIGSCLPEILENQQHFSALLNDILSFEIRVHSHFLTESTFVREICVKVRSLLLSLCFERIDVMLTDSFYFFFRVLSLICISLTLYGGGCVFIVLIAQLLGSLLETWANIHLSLCLWMVIVAFCLIPLTWLGTPKDFW